MGAPIGTQNFKDRWFQSKIDDINMKIKRITNVTKTSPHSAFYLYSAAVKHELTYIQTIGIGEKMIKETAKELKIFSKSLVGQCIRDENVMSEIANPTRFGGLAINASNLVEE